MKLDGFQTFFTSFVVGTLNLVGLCLIVLGLRAEQEGVSMIRLLNDSLRSIAPFGLFLGTVATVIAVFIGQVIDALGHLTLDKLLQPRVQYCDSDKQRVMDDLIARFPGVDRLDVPTAIRAIFFAHATEHMFSFREDQWKIYEIYRNSVVTIGILLICSISLVFYNPTLVKILLWLLSAALLCVLALGMKPCMQYFRGVESSYAIGWLYEKSISSTRGAGGAVEGSQSPALQRTAGTAA